MNNSIPKYQHAYCTLQQRTADRTQSYLFQTVISRLFISFLMSTILIFSNTNTSAQALSPPATPQPATFSPYNYTVPSNNQSKTFINQSQQHNTYNSYINDQQQSLIQQKEIDDIKQEASQAFAPPAKQKAAIDADFDTTFGNTPIFTREEYLTTKPFWDAMVTLADMANGSRPFSITEAIFTVENAYFHNQLAEDMFYRTINARVELCKQIMQREKLNPNNNLAKNYAIQKLYERDNDFINPITKKAVKVPKLQYDFTDFMGDSSHTAMFISKLLATGKGQCHSMPLLYLAIAEQLGAKANLSLAPAHSFIRFSDDDGSMYNYETTNGSVVSDNWMLQSGYINTTAIKNKIYLDTLSQKQLLAYCMLDLAMGYQHDYGYDGFTEVALKYALQLDPNGIIENIMLSNVWEQKIQKAIRYYGIQNKDQFEQNPITKTLQHKLFQQYDIIDNLGHQDMPKEAYTAWLQSVNAEKEKQDEEELQQFINIQLQKTKINITLPTKKE